MRAIVSCTQRLLCHARQRLTTGGDALCTRLLKKAGALSHKLPCSKAYATAVATLRFTVCFSLFIFLFWCVRKENSSGRELYDHVLLYAVTPYPVTLRAKTVFIVQVPFGTKMAAMSRRSGRSRVCYPPRGLPECSRGVAARVTLWRCRDALSSL